jgi:uncharacterized protein YmfQ (DUF2313 family)
MAVGSLFSLSDYASILSALMPRGRFWSRDPGSTQQQVLAAFAPTAQRVDAAAQALLEDAFPSTAVGLLPQWESSLGLTLSDAAGTTAQRQANVVAELVAVGGQSGPDFIAFAAELGFTITIERYAPFRCGLNFCGDAIGGEDWCFAWSITVVANTGTLTSGQLLAKIQAIAPAETTVFLSS